MFVLQTLKLTVLKMYISIPKNVYCNLQLPFRLLICIQVKNIENNFQRKKKSLYPPPLHEKKFLPPQLGEKNSSPPGNAQSIPQVYIAASLTANLIVFKSLKSASRAAPLYFSAQCLDSL